MTYKKWRESLSKEEQLEAVIDKIGKEEFERIIKNIYKGIEIQEDKKTKFYTFRQNNSGGSFDFNENLCVAVIIEAYDSDDANNRAREIGIYFDGVCDGRDCGCCGDRWHTVDEGDGKDIPMVYGEDISNMKKECFIEYCIVHYINGTKKKIVFPKEVI